MKGLYSATCLDCSTLPASREQQELIQICSIKPLPSKQARTLFPMAC